MGPSGSGKSTLLTISGTLEEPSSGEVLIGDVAVSGLSRNDKARLRRQSIGYVFQDYNLLAGLTAAENVSLPLELDGAPMRTAARGDGRARGARARGPCRTDFPTSSRAANGNGSRSRARSSASGICCWRTNRPARSIPSTARP